VSKVVIAYCNESWWLVAGVTHLNDMLRALAVVGLPDTSKLAPSAP